MRRRLAMLLSATLLAGIAAVLVPASPASAGIHICGGVGTAALTGGLTYPVTVATDLPPHPIHSYVHQARTTVFGFNFTTGACVNSNAPTVKSPTLGTGVTAVGTVSGWCGLSSGTGTITKSGASARFAWIGIGGTLVLTGGAIGVVQAVPDTLAGHSCNNHTGASQFTVAGAVVAFDHCLPTKPKNLTTLGAATLTSTLVTLPTGTPVSRHSVHTGLWHVWTKVCVPVPVL